MGKSRFEGMEIAIREQAKITMAGADDKVQIETLKAELADIDADTKQRIEEIKAAPIDKGLLQKQAENDLASIRKSNERDCSTKILAAEQAIKQAEHDAEESYAQAKLDIERKKGLLQNIKETAVEVKDMNNLEAEQEYENVIASIGNSEKTIELKIRKEEANGQKRKREIEIQLRSLEARNNVIEEQKKGWKKFYEDTVEISKMPQQ